MFALCMEQGKSIKVLNMKEFFKILTSWNNCVIETSGNQQKFQRETFLQINVTLLNVLLACE